MSLAQTIASIDGCATVPELKQKLHEVAQNYGFQSFSFIDVGDPTQDLPFYITTIDQSWDDDYRSNQFYQVDPMLPIVRRRNIPFTWSDVPLPENFGRRKPGAIKTMEAAHDHGFKEGLVIPFHFRDDIGRVNSASCVFFWKDDIKSFRKVLPECSLELHVIMIYWSHRAVSLAAADLNRRQRFVTEEGTPLTNGGGLLTDRERDVLSWAARGKTMGETADILGISGETVETYVRHAMRKLGSANKTQAVANAIYLGLIDI